MTTPWHNTEISCDAEHRKQKSTGSKKKELEKRLDGRKDGDTSLDLQASNQLWSQTNLLVEGLGEGGGGSDVGIAGSLVGTSGLLEVRCSSQVFAALGLVGSGVVGLKVDIVEKGEHRSMERCA
jgi:hypothetical protein